MHLAADRTQKQALAPPIFCRDRILTGGRLAGGRRCAYSAQLRTQRTLANGVPFFAPAQVPPLRRRGVGDDRRAQPSEADRTIFVWKIQCRLFPPDPAAAVEEFSSFLQRPSHSTPLPSGYPCHDGSVRAMTSRTSTLAPLPEHRAAHSSRSHKFPAFRPVLPGPPSRLPSPLSTTFPQSSYTLGYDVRPREG